MRASSSSISDAPSRLMMLSICYLDKSKMLFSTRMPRQTIGWRKTVNMAIDNRSKLPLRITADSETTPLTHSSLEIIAQNKPSLNNAINTHYLAKEISHTHKRPLTNTVLYHTIRPKVDTFSSCLPKAYRI